MQVVDCKTQQVLLPHVEVASTRWQRFRGLMFRRSFGEGYGLLLTPCGSVHTMWMKVPIDVYFIAKDGTVKEHRKHVAPWSVVVPAERSHCVLEIPNAKTSLSVGTRIRLQEDPSAIHPPSGRVEAEARGFGEGSATAFRRPDV